MTDSKELIERLLELKDFLDGSRAIKNMWIGESYGIGPYWWRSQHLPVLDKAAAHIAALEARVEVLDGALRECIDVMEPLAKYPKVNPWLLQAKAALGGKDAG